MSSKTNTKIQTATAESPAPPRQLELPFPPVPSDAIQEILRMLYNLATKENNTSAAKLFVDVLKIKSDDTPSALTAEDALKIIREHLRDAA